VAAGDVRLERGAAWRADFHAVVASPAGISGEPKITIPGDPEGLIGTAWLARLDYQLDGDCGEEMI